MPETVSFTAMADGTREDYEMLAEREKIFNAGTADRLIQEMRGQAGDTITGYKISRLEHGLQTATRARRDGADIDWVVAALLHDIGDGLAPQNHDKFAAEIMRPFMRDEVVWVVEHHGVFQMYYYAHHYGWDRELRETYKESPYYQSCVDFCARWDQSSFDPDYPMDPLESFEADIRTVFSRKAYDADVQQVGVVRGLPQAA